MSGSLFLAKDANTDFCYDILIISTASDQNGSLKITTRNCFCEILQYLTISTSQDQSFSLKMRIRIFLRKKRVFTILTAMGQIFKLKMRTWSFYDFCKFGRFSVDFHSKRQLSRLLTNFN